MSFKNNLRSALVLVLAIAVGTFILWPGTSRTGTVTITSTPGTIVEISYELDGQTFVLEQEVPVEFGVRGKEFSCSVENTTKQNPVSVSLVLPDGSLARTTGRADQDLECGFRSGKLAKSSVSLWAKSVQPI